MQAYLHIHCMHAWLLYMQHSTHITTPYMYCHEHYTVKNKWWYLWQGGGGNCKRKWTSPHLPWRSLPFAVTFTNLATDITTCFYSDTQKTQTRWCTSVAAILYAMQYIRIHACTFTSLPFCCTSCWLVFTAALQDIFLDGHSRMLHSFFLTSVVRIKGEHVHNTHELGTR